MKQSVSPRLKPRLGAWPHRKKALGIVAAVAAAAALFVILSFAASSPIAKEAESGTRTGSATQISDGSASGGYAVRFGAAGGTGGGIGGGAVGADGTLSGNQYFCAQPNAGVGGVGVRLLTQTCDKSQPQVVNFIKDSSKEGGMVRFKTSQLCMKENGTADLSQISLATCDYTNDAMRWISQSDNSLKNAESGNCLRPRGGGAAVALYLEITNCYTTASSANQLWCLPNTCNGSVNDTFGAEGSFANRNQYCAQPNAGVSVVGARLVTQVCNGTEMQKMVYIKSDTKDGGMIRFKTMYLCMAEAGTADLSQVKLAKCDTNSNAMRWIPQEDNGFKNAESGRCLRPLGGGFGPSLYLEVTNCSATSASPNQSWNLYHQ